MKYNSSSHWHDTLTQLKVVVIIPTYNNAKTLESVINSVRFYAKDIFVVNDGATDETASILARQTTDLHIITHVKNRGKGAALKHSLSKAKALGFRYAITIDSDGQHSASDIPIFIETIEREPDTLLIGARNLASENMPSKNTFANKFSNFWFTLETGVKLQDTQSGFRLYPLQKLNVAAWYYTAKYEFELEAIVFASWKEVKVMNVPISVYYPPQEERVSHFRPFRDFTRISILNTILVLITFLWIYPRNFVRQLTWSNIKLFIAKHFTQSKVSNRKIALSVMLGIFMGIVPVWGYQMLLTIFFAHLFKLNKVIALVAANISLPPIIPFLLYGSYYIGCKVTGAAASLCISDISLENIRSVIEQYLIGSILLASISSLIAGVIVYTLLFVFKRSKTS